MAEQALNLLAEQALNLFAVLLLWLLPFIIALHIIPQLLACGIIVIFQACLEGGFVAARVKICTSIQSSISSMTHRNYRYYIYFQMHKIWTRFPANRLNIALQKYIQQCGSVGVHGRVTGSHELVHRRTVTFFFFVIMVMLIKGSSRGTTIRCINKVS